MNSKKKFARLGTAIGRTIMGHAAPDIRFLKGANKTPQPSPQYQAPEVVLPHRLPPHRALPPAGGGNPSIRPQLVLVQQEDDNYAELDAFSRFDAAAALQIHSNAAVANWSQAPRNSGTGTVAQLFSLLRRNLRLILTTGIGLLLAVSAATAISSMKFEANSRLYLGDLEKSEGAKTEDLDLNGRGQGDLGSEEEIIKSESLVTKAILASGGNVSITPVNWSSPRYVQWRLSGRDSRLLDPSLREVRVAGTSITTPSQKDREFRVLFTEDNRYEVHEGDRFVGAAMLEQPTTLGDLQIALYKGWESAPRKGVEYELTVHSLEKTVAKVQEELEVVTQRRTGGVEPSKVVTLKYAASSPLGAQRFLAELMNGYLEEKQAWKTADASAAESFISDQLKTTREKLDAVQKKLVEFRANNPVVVLDSEAEAMVGQIRTYEEQRVQSRLEVAGLRDISKALKSSASVEGYMMGEANDSVLVGMANSLAESKRKLSELETRFSAESPDVHAQKQQVDAQLRSIKSYVTSRLARAESNLGSISGIIGQYEAKLRTVPAAEASLAELTREAEVHNAVHSQLLKRQQENAIQKASTVSKNRVLDEAKAPLREVSPSLPARMASLPLGLIIGIVLVILRSVARGLIESEDDAVQICGARPILAKVPRQKDRAAPPIEGHLDPFGFECSYGFFESFRELRSNLYVKLGRKGGIITITSPSPGDGKTTCALAMAASLASGGHSVLVLDLVLRNQTHTALLNQRRGPGLFGVFTQGIDWRSQVRSIPVPLGEFHSMDMGVVAPPETLSSPAMHRFLQEVGNHYDYVLMDTPSYPESTDALHLVSLSDAVISVLRLESTSKKLAQEHLSRFASNRVHTMCVLNGVAERSSVAHSEQLLLEAGRT